MRLDKEKTHHSGSAWQRPTLPGPFGPSTIGAGGLNGRVRDGYAWFPSAIATKRIASKEARSFKTEQVLRVFLRSSSRRTP
jgi:hypothetical protein